MLKELNSHFSPPMLMLSCHSKISLAHLIKLFVTLIGTTWYHL